MPKFTEFELQIEGVNSNDDNILCEIVEEDEAGTLPVAVTIADVVRGKQKEACSIFREKMQQQQHSTIKITSSVAAPFRQNRHRNLRAMGRDPKVR